LRTLIHAHFNPVSIAMDHALMARGLKMHDAFVDADVQLGRLSRTEGERAKAMVRERTVGGGHMEMQAKTMLHRTADQFLQSGQTPKLVRAAALVMGAAGKFPPVRAVLGFVRWYSDAVMHSINGRMESHIQMAQAGREARLNLIDRRMPAVSEAAVRDLASGLRGTGAQVELGRMVDRAYGQYSKFSPTMRWLISAYTPFLPWTINAVRFLTQVLPADHPVLTGLAAANVNAQADWIKATGMGPGQVPPWLLGTYPLAGGAHMPLSRYTPFGVAGDLLGSPLNLIMPQVMPLIRGWAGFDFKWQPVKGLNGWQDQFVYGLDQFMQANIPVYGPIRGIFNRKEPGVLGKLGGWVNPVTPYVQHGAAGGGGDNGGVLKGGGAGAGSNGGVLKSLEAQHVPGLGFVQPQALGGLLAGLGRASVQLDAKRRRMLAQRGTAGTAGDVLGGMFGNVGTWRPVHHASGLPKIAAGVLAGSVANAGTYHPGRYPTAPQDPGIVAPRNAAHLMSATAQLMSSKDFHSNPQLLPLGKLARTLGPGTPGSVKALFRQAPALVGQQVLAKVGQGVVPGGVLPSVQLRRFARFGVKNSAGGVIIPAARAKRQVRMLSALGYGNGQIVSHLQSGTPLRSFRRPAALARAMTVLQGVKGPPPTSERGVVAAAAQKYGVDPHLLWGMYGAESNFGKNKNTSSKGAYGPWQFMPGTARSYGLGSNYTFKQGAYAAAKYISQYKSRGPAGMLAAYNAGPAGNPNNAQTQAYIPEVMRLGRSFGAGVRLTPRQKQAVKVAQRAAVAWQNVGSGGGGPVRAGIFADPSHSGRIDMGWDVTGAGPVAAFAPGKVTRSTTASSWPGHGMVTVKLDHPITRGGKTYRYMYYAENIAPQVRVGQHVKAGQPLAQARGSYPYTEQGFAVDPYGTTAAHGHYTEGQVTAEGRAFYDWAHSKAGKAAVNRKGGPRMSQLPRPIQRFLKRYAPAAAAPGGVSSGGSVSSSGGGTSVSGGSSSGGAAGGSSSGLAAIIKQLAGSPVPVSSALSAPWFATGPALVQQPGPQRRRKSYI
jgi:hypothetical protein